MRSLATNSTADHLVDFLASNGASDQWTYFADLREWEVLYNLLGERHLIGRLARNLSGRGLAEFRRAALGMQLRLTPDGEKLAQHREQEASEAAAGLDWGRMLN